MANQTPNLKVRYEFDQTGRNPNNLVSNEEHTTTQRLRKIIVPHYGHFYNHSVVLTDLTTGLEVPKTDYFFEDPSEVIALKTGLEASMVIVVTNSKLSNRFAVTYQSVGGEFTGANVKLLAQKLEALNHDNRPIEWENIKNKPTTYNPAEHRHPIYQTFGYESLIYIIERYIRAVLVGDEASHDVIWDELGKIRKLIDTSVNPVVTDFATFKSEQEEALRRLKKAVDDQILQTLKKNERAADTTLFMGKTYETVLVETSDRSLQDHKDDFVHMGTGVNQVKPVGSGSALSNVVKIGKDVNTKNVNVSVDSENYGSIFTHRGEISNKNLNEYNSIDHIGIYKVVSGTTANNAPIESPATLFVLPSTYGVTQLYIPDPSTAESTHLSYKRTSTQGGQFSNWTETPDYRKVISHQIAGQTETKIASEKAVGDLNKHIAAKIDNEIKNTLKENILKYVDGQTTLDRQAINKALFGKSFNLGIGSANVVNRQFANLDIDQSKVTQRITELFGTEQPKLVREVIPISTVESNMLRWNNDGLYYGNIPDELTRELYVDPTTGVDEAITETNGRGRKNKPLASLAFALTQGPSGVDRVIYLAEGKEHKVGRTITAINNGTATYESVPSNIVSHDSATIRGGKVTIDIYGPKIDAVYSRYDAARDYIDSVISDDISVVRQIKQINTRLTFIGATVGSKVLYRGNVRKAISLTCMDFLNSPTVIFKNMILNNGTIETSVINNAINSLVHAVSEESRFNRWQSADITFANCCFNTGVKYINNEQHVVSTFMKTSSAYKNVSIQSNRLEAEFLYGDGILVNYDSNNSSLQGRQNITAPRFFEISGDGHVPGRIYFTGLKIGNGEYINVRTNFYPDDAKSLNVIKRTSGSISTQKADIEIDSDGKIYCIYYNTTTRQVTRVQLYPARWAE